MPDIDPDSFSPEQVSYSIRGRRGPGVRMSRFEITSSLFAAVMGLSVLLGRKRA